MMEHGKRSCGLGFGLMLIIIGTIWLAAQMGWIIPDLFWPVAFLSVGLVVLTLNLIRGRRPLNDTRTNKEV
jgi:uncharacterized membrane protein